MHHLILGTINVAPRVVDQHHRVFAVLVTEIIGNPFIFQEPRNKLEIRFAILNAVLTGGVRSAQFELVIGESHLIEDGLHDLDRRLLLEDPAVRSAREHPEPGDELKHVAPCAVEKSADDQTVDDPVKRAIGGIQAAGNAQRNSQPDEIGCLDRGVAQTSSSWNQNNRDRPRFLRT